MHGFWCTKGTCPSPAASPFGHDGSLYLASGIGPSGEGDHTVVVLEPDAAARPRPVVTGHGLSPLVAFDFETDQFLGSVVQHAQALRPSARGAGLASLSTRVESFPIGWSQADEHSGERSRHSHRRSRRRTGPPRAGAIAEREYRSYEGGTFRDLGGRDVRALSHCRNGSR
jgi:hypothetical protein